jgi:hypothetical protein
VLLAVAGSYLAARLILAETIPGNRQFWITRSYRWSSLLFAKLLGLVVFVNAPILAARLYVLMEWGFPLRTTLAPLAWSQLCFFVGVTIPVAALAAVTSGMVEFIFAALILATCGFVINAWVTPPSAPAVRLNLDGSQWVWDSIAVLTLTAFAVPVLYLQYRKRWTLLSRSVILAIVVVGALAYMYVPWPVAAAIQSSISTDNFDVRGVSVTLVPEAKQFSAPSGMWRGDVQVDVPLAVGGIPEDAEMIPDAVKLSFQAADGSGWTSGPYRYVPLGKQSEGPGASILNANVDLPIEFFRHAIQQPIKIKGSLYMTVFGNPRARTIPIRKTPVDALDGLQYTMGALGLSDQLSCGVAFRWPSELIYAKFGSDGMIPFTRVVSYSPLPAGLDFLAYKSREVSIPTGAKEVTIVAEERLASFRRDFEIPDFPLALYSQPVTSRHRD